MVAAASDAGLYFSRDLADTFERLGEPGYVLAVSFDVDGEYLWFSGYAADKPSLMRILLASGATATDDVFVSHDLGKTWTQIAVAGAATK